MCTRDPTHSLSKRSQLNKNRAPERHRVDVKKKKEREKEEKNKEGRNGKKERRGWVKKREESNISFASTTIPPEAVLLWRGSERVRVLVGHVESDYLTRALAHV